MISFLDNMTRPSNWMNAMKAISPIDLFNKNQFTKLKQFYGDNGVMSTLQQTLSPKRYMAGETLLGSSPMSKEATIKARKIALGVGGGLLAANALLPDSFISRQGNFLAQAAGHTMLTRALYAKNKIAGGAFGAWAGYNALSAGNQLGPF